MIDERLLITIYRKNEQIVGFDVSGHAHYDEPGRDIVCAGVSVVAQTVMQAMYELTDIKKYEYKIDEGHSFLKIDPSNIDEKVELLFKTFLIGVEGIHNSYNKYINIVEQEVN